MTTSSSNKIFLEDAIEYRSRKRAHETALRVNPRWILIAFWAVLVTAGSVLIASGVVQVTEYTFGSVLTLEPLAPNLGSDLVRIGITFPESQMREFQGPAFIQLNLVSSSRVVHVQTTAIRAEVMQSVCIESEKTIQDQKPGPSNHVLWLADVPLQKLAPLSALDMASTHGTAQIAAGKTSLFGLMLNSLRPKPSASHSVSPR